MFSSFLIQPPVSVREMAIWLFGFTSFLHVTSTGLAPVVSKLLPQLGLLRLPVGGMHPAWQRRLRHFSHSGIRGGADVEVPRMGVTRKDCRPVRNSCTASRFLIIIFDLLLCSIPNPAFLVSIRAPHHSIIIAQLVGGSLHQCTNSELHSRGT